jgi:pimeloyl-ACP methyl ester carboxylesterase
MSSDIETPRLAELTGVTHRFVELPGLRLHYAEAGSGDPILLLHGFPQHWWEWRGVLPVLSPGYRVLCPDLRGAGWTDAPPTGYDRATLLGDVVALLDALGLDRVHLVAHDWGALVAFALCLEHPTRVRSLVSLATPHPFVRPHPGLVRVLPHLWFQEVVATPMLGPRLLGRGGQRLARHLLTAFTAEGYGWREDDLEAFLAPLRDPRRAGAASRLYRRFILPEAMRIMSGRYRSRHLETPTRIVYGASDPGFRPEFLDGWQGHAGDFAVQEVPGAAHFLADERPDAVARIVLELIARV